MTYTYKNITGNTAQILMPMSTLQNAPIKRLNICNTHSSDSVKIDLYLYREELDLDLGDATHVVEIPSDNDYTVTTTTETYYILKSIDIPYATTLQLEENDLLINYISPKYNLYIKLDQSDSAVDIIINN